MTRPPLLGPITLRASPIAAQTITRRGVTIVTLDTWLTPSPRRRMRFRRGAITAGRDAIPLLIGHDPNIPPAGDVTDLAEITDPSALTATITMPTDDARTASTIARLAAGRPVPLSIGANILDADRVEGADGVMEDTITVAELLEVSLVGLQADPRATLTAHHRPDPHPILTAAMAWADRHRR